MRRFFNFGKNWKEFSSSSLTPESLEQAKKSLLDILGTDGIRGKSFVDIGCGSGIFSICASLLGAEKVIGIDVNPICIEVSHDNAGKFIPVDPKPVFKQVSILDRAEISAMGKFDIVYAWGSLHHTGNMWEALDITCGLVKEKGGVLWTSIYNKNITSPLWKQIKKLFNKVGDSGKLAMIYVFYVIIFGAKFLTTFRNPLKKERGMSFYFDVVDWLGGYPYEYSLIEQVVQAVEKKGFRSVKTIPTSGFTGCNEYLFQKL